jgi:hypothetical protein
MLESKGWKRALSIILFLAAKIPQAAPYEPVIEAVAGILGVVGLGHAALKK